MAGLLEIQRSSLTRILCYVELMKLTSAFSWLTGLFHRTFKPATSAVAEGINMDETPPSPTAAPENIGVVSSDVPIREPEQDAYGIDDFAKAISRSIANANAAEGLVFAINGPWGSGKSSACNLVLHHLQEQIRTETIIPITFNPWWFSGTEALTMSFFQELSVPIGKSVSDQAREILATLGRRVSSVGPLLEPLATILGAPGAGAIMTGSAGVAAKFKPGGTVEEEHQKLAQALREQSKKFLVVIDDIDRLGTDEALQIFRLVKSVGKLPNVVYLLAFDRQLAERMISERFPSEGASYLDKFIQGGFDLPMPDSHDLREAVLRVIDQVMNGVDDEKLTRFFNLFYDVCAPLICLPRDAVRLSNAIRVSWPAIGADVDKADFLTLETLRLFLPTVHKAIRSHPDMLCGASDRHNSTNSGQEQARYNAVFFTGLSDRDRQIAQRAIQRLFPKTDNVWSNIMHTDRQTWRLNRLVCSEAHFSTYFGFSVDEEAVTASELQELLRVAANPDEVAELFRRAVAQRRRRRGTRAALLLEELQVQAGNVPEQHIESLLTGLFRVADEIDVDADKAGGFAIGDNQLRIHWLLNNLLRNRFPQERRGEILERVCETSALGWLINFSNRSSREHSPANDEQRENQQEPFISNEVSNRIARLALDRLRAAAEDGSIVRQKRIMGLLLEWDDRGNEGEVRQWTDAQLENNDFIINLAERLIRHSWTQGMGLFGDGDRVARRHDYVHLEPYTAVLDIPRFRTRVQQLLEDPNLPEDSKRKLERFTAVPERDPGSI